jgi:inhibitor of KinA
MEYSRIYSIHEQAITFEFADEISEVVNIHVIDLKHYIDANPFKGLIECVPAYSSLTVYFNTDINKNEVIELVSNYNLKLTTQTSIPNSEIITIPVCYEMGEDIESVASTLNIKKEEVIQLHTANIYRVYMIGFTPGFPYMGTLPKALTLPRKDTPLLNVPAGSVAIAGNQTGIYPFNTPGGWHIIGRTPIKMFDQKNIPCSFLKPGESVQFQPIRIEAFNQYK